jgi:hypothetical protein
MSKQNITQIPHPYLWGPTDRYTPFYSLFRDKLSLPRELVFVSRVQLYEKLADFYAKLNVSNLYVTNLY